MIVSLCPPHAAVEVARPLASFDGIYVDANAISPATARAVAGLVRRYVDGGVVGPPPRSPGTTRLYLSGPEAAPVAGLFAGTTVEPVVVSAEPTAASAVKMAYAAWSKGTAALLLAIRALARAEGVEDALLAEWARSLPELLDRSEAAARSAGGRAGGGSVRWTRSLTRSRQPGCPRASTVRRPSSTAAFRGRMWTAASSSGCSRRSPRATPSGKPGV